MPVQLRRPTSPPSVRRPLLTPPLRRGRVACHVDEPTTWPRRRSATAETRELPPRWQEQSDGPMGVMLAGAALIGRSLVGLVQVLSHLQRWQPPPS